MIDMIVRNFSGNNGHEADLDLSRFDSQQIMK